MEFSDNSNYSTTCHNYKQMHVTANSSVFHNLQRVFSTFPTPRIQMQLSTEIARNQLKSADNFHLTAEISAKMHKTANSLIYHILSAAK